MKELIRVRVQYVSRQQCCKTNKRPLPLPLPYPKIWTFRAVPGLLILVIIYIYTYKYIYIYIYIYIYSRILVLTGNRIHHSPNRHIRSVNSGFRHELGEMFALDMIYLLNAIGLPPNGRSTVHIYKQTIHRTTQKFWGITQRFLTPENGTDRLSRNVDKELPLLAA